MIEKLAQPEIKNLLVQKRFEEIKTILSEVHPEDIALLLQGLGSSEDRIIIFRLLTPQKAIEVFDNLEPEEQKKILFGLTNDKVRQILNEMSPDERTELLEEMPAELVKKLLNYLSSEERKIAVELLGYPEESVGRLITPEFVQLYEDLSVEEALNHIRKVGLDKETVYHCYVLDRSKRLIGVVSLKNLVLASSQTKLKEIMNRDVIKVNVFTDREEAANIFKKYDLLALPAVDNEDKLVGIVTFDDFVDVLEEEATEDFEKIAAVLPVDKPYMEAGFLEIIWKRSFWLIVLLVLESLSGFVLQHYSGVIGRLIALTFFLPILIGTGGNAGTQSATVVIRGLATGEIRPFEFLRVIIKEASLGFFIGLILAMFGFIRAFFQQGDWWLSICVGIAMGATIVLATTVGALLPLAIRKINLDPAVMSGPLITTIVDITGIIIYFEIASWLLKLH